MLPPILPTGRRLDGGGFAVDRKCLQPDRRPPPKTQDPGPLTCARRTQGDPDLSRRIFLTVFVLPRLWRWQTTNMRPSPPWASCARGGGDEHRGGERGKGAKKGVRARGALEFKLE